MNQPIIHKILAALGYDQNQQEKEELYIEEYNRVEALVSSLNKVAKNKVLYKVLDLSTPSEAAYLKEKILLGTSIHAFLKEPQKIILLATTLGSQVDQLIRKEVMLSISRGLVVDTAAMEVIESHLDDFEGGLSSLPELSGYYFSPRFSPGYGDLPLTIQKDILQVLETQKQIGLSVSSSGILLPKKSVTALIGVYDKPFETTYSNCDSCLIRHTCKKRERGNYCGY